MEQPLVSSVESTLLQLVTPLVEQLERPPSGQPVGHDPSSRDGPIGGDPVIVYKLVLVVTKAAAECHKMCKGAATGGG